MLKNSYRYVKSIIEGEKILRDTKNKYRFVSQRPSREKRDSDGNITLEEGTVCTLSILEDISEPVVNKKTGEVMENNQFENFDVTVLGHPYPLPFKKGDVVRLGGFDEVNSYYIDFNLILRFREIERVNEK